MVRTRVVVVLVCALASFCPVGSDAASEWLSRPGTVRHTLALPDGVEVLLDSMIVYRVIGPYAFVRDPWSRSPMVAVHVGAPVGEWWSVGIAGRTASVGGVRVVAAERLRLYVDFKGDPVPMLPKGKWTPIAWPHLIELPVACGLIGPMPPVPDPNPPAPEESFLLAAEPGTIASAKLSGGNVTLEGKVVTAVFRQPGTGAVERFYIEEPDRSCGVKVVPQEWMQAWLPVESGNVVALSGAVRCEPSDPECYVEASKVRCTGSCVVEPVGLCQRSACGREFGLQPGLYADSTSNPPVEGGGLSAVGLRVKVWGEVTSVRSESGRTTYYIDDGSGLRCSSGGQQRHGIGLVYSDWPSAPEYEIGEYVQGVTGVLAAELSGEFPVPIVRVPCLRAGVAIRVSPDGNDGNDGSTWALAKQTVQAAVNAASAGDEVWVKAGTYSENIILADGVAVYGGFCGTETRREQRNWSANVTILDGSRSGSVVTALSGVGPTSRIDGFTIRNGSGTLHEELYGYCGGGILCDLGSPAIVNNAIVSNVVGYPGAWGGGIFCRGSSSAIWDNSISGNTAARKGGGANYGGTTGQPVVRGNVFHENVATVEGAGLACLHGAKPAIEANVFEGNFADYDGSHGGHGGAITMERGADCSIVNNLFVGNYTNGAIGGGAIQAYDSSPVIVNNTFVDNRAVNAHYYGGGGAILIRAVEASAQAMLINNIFYRNKAYEWEQDDSVGNSVARVGPQGSAEVLYCAAFSDVLGSATESYHYLDADVGEGCYIALLLPEDLPVFVDESGGDYHLRLPGPEYTPVDQGHNRDESLYEAVPTDDLDRNPRPIDIVIPWVPNAGPNAYTDMGAYEVQE